MRDGAIHAMQQANGKRSALLLGQFEFLQTRQEAYERVLRVSKLRDRIKWVIWPAQLLAVVDAVQLTLLDKNRKALEAAAAKPKIEVVGAGALVKG